MPINHNADKKREVGTYRRLGLDRQAKSIRRRRQAEEGGLYRFIGGLGPERPWLKVPRADFLRVHQEVMAQWKEKRPADDLTDEQWNDLVRGLIERETYDRLASLNERMEQLDTEFQGRQGRPMTIHEAEQFSKSMESPTPAANARARALRTRQKALRDVVGAVRKVRQNAPGQLQELWAQVVGAELAEQSSLESLDPTEGVAWCRCYNGTSAFVLRRQRTVPRKLSELTGIRIKRLAFR